MSALDHLTDGGDLFSEILQRERSDMTAYRSFYWGSKSTGLFCRSGKGT